MLLDKEIVMKRKLFAVAIAFSVIFTSYISAQMTQEAFEKKVSEEFSNCLSSQLENLNPLLIASHIEKSLTIKDANNIDDVIYHILSTADGKIHYIRIRGLFRDYSSKSEMVLIDTISPNAGNVISVIPNSSIPEEYYYMFNLYYVNNATISRDVSLKANLLSQMYNLPTVFEIKGGTFKNKVADFYLATGTFMTESGKNQTYIEIAYINILGYPYFKETDFMVALNFRMMKTNEFWEQYTDAFSKKIFNPYNFIFVDPYEIMLMVELYPEELKSVSSYNWDSGKQLWYSDVVFKEQTNMSISVGSEDGTFFQTMNFAGRTSSLKNGDKVRIYYSVEKKSYSTDWTVYAIEKLQ